MRKDIEFKRPACGSKRKFAGGDLEDRAATCTLLVFVDDATSRLMELRFVASESTFAYFEALKAYLRRHGSIYFQKIAETVVYDLPQIEPTDAVFALFFTQP